MKNRSISIILGSMLLISFISMTPTDVIDYLSAGKQLNFNGAKYDLKWSSHPSDNYYKQEYLKQGEELPSYHNMILEEAVQGNLKVSDAINAKASELTTRKSWDAI